MAWIGQRSVPHCVSSEPLRGAGRLRVRRAALRGSLCPGPGLRADSLSSRSAPCGGPRGPRCRCRPGRALLKRWVWARRYGRGNPARRPGGPAGGGEGGGGARRVPRCCARRGGGERLTGATFHKTAHAIGSSPGAPLQRRARLAASPSRGGSRGAAGALTAVLSLRRSALRARPTPRRFAPLVPPAPAPGAAATCNRETLPGPPPRPSKSLPGKPEPSGRARPAAPARSEPPVPPSGRSERPRPRHGVLSPPSPLPPCGDRSAPPAPCAPNGAGTAWSRSARPRCCVGR